MPIILLQFSHSYLLKRFWNWWRQQLSPWIPEKVRRLLTQKNQFYITFTDEKTVTILRQQADKKLCELTRLPVQEIRLWIEETNLPDNPIFILLLSSGQYLRRRFTLPSAAQENLKQVVGFELDRHTPFTIEQVYFGVRIAESLPKQNQIVADVVLTPKTVLDDFVNKLLQVGISLHQVTVIPDSGPLPELNFDLLPPQFRSKPNRWLQALNLGLAGILLILLLSVFAIPIIHYNQTIQSLEGKVKQARQAAIRANNIKQELHRLEKQASFVLDKKKTSPSLIVVLEELSQRLPQDTWLTGFQYRDGQVNIDGKSPAASKLVELLEESPYLKNVHFVSPITQDRSSGLERFRISMEIADGTKPDTND